MARRRDWIRVVVKGETKVVTGTDCGEI